jgi:diguanylate cyclase (GGDEF)-like protein
MPDEFPMPDAALLEILEQVLTFEDLNSALRYLCYGLEHLFPCDAVGILVADEESATIVATLAKSVAKDFVSHLDSKIVSQYETHSGQTLARESLLTEVHGAPLNPEGSTIPGSMMTITLREGGTVKGLLGMAATPPNAFGAPDTERLDWASGWIGLTLRALLRMRKMSSYDPLTGLFNRRRIEDELEQSLAMARRYDHAVGLVIVDVDELKEVNDVHGHLVGDEVLREFAGLLKKNARASDIVGRLGGDEFVVILPRAQAAAAQIFAERLCAEVRRHTFRADSRHLRLTASIGISDSVIAGLETYGTNLLATADQALYAAKKAGRNKVVRADKLPG